MADDSSAADPAVVVVVEERAMAVVDEEEEEGGGAKGETPAAEMGGCVVLDVVGSGDRAENDGSDREKETPRRICHLSPHPAEEVSELFLPECGSKDGEQRSGADPPGAPPLEAAAVAAIVEERAAVAEEEEEEGGGGGKGEAGGAPAACVVVDVVGLGGKAAGDGSDWEAEQACRICHLSTDQGEDGSELLQLGCGCKGELGIAHRHCAEAWFKVKGNRCCEICGANAKNITGEDDNKFMDEWYERGELSNRNSSDRCGCWRRQPFCNFLMACLVIAFIIPWFFRVNMF